MQARQLYTILSPFNKLINKRALAAEFRVLALSSDEVRGCAPFGAMRASVKLGTEGAVYVDADDFLSVLRSLPDKDFEIKLGEKALQWRCGGVRGHLAAVSDDTITVASPHFEGEIYDIEGDFATGLELGALASGTMSVRTMALEGVQVRNVGSKAYACSSNSQIISIAELGPAISGLPEDQAITLKAESAELLAAAIRSHEPSPAAPNPMLGYDARSIYFISSHLELQVNQVSPLESNVYREFEPYFAHDKMIEINRDAVTAFLRRVQALVNLHQKLEVQVNVVEGRVGLHFASDPGSTSEYYIVNDAPNITMPPMYCEAKGLSIALSHAEFIAFDHVTTGVLVLHGERGDFMFGISGQPGELEAVAALTAREAASAPAA